MLMGVFNGGSGKHSIMDMCMDEQENGTLFAFRHE